MINSRRLVFALFSVSLVAAALAAPAVVAVRGTFAYGKALQIDGVGFGQKYPAKPYIWADFENGLAPSSLGVRTSWDQVENMEWSTGGINGSHSAHSMYVDNKLKDAVSWTLRADFDAWSRENQRFYIYKKHRMNFAITDRSQNWKVFRMWPTGAHGYPNVYGASNNGRVYVEGAASGYWATPIDGLRTNSTDWVNQEIIGKASSGLNVADGSLVFRNNGVTIGQGSGIMYRTSTYPSYMTCLYPVHDVSANTSLWSPAWSTNNSVWVDDVYVDNTWARVMVGDQPTFSTCHKLEIQIPQTWTDTSITVMANQGLMPSGSVGYLYVFDRDGNVNSAGYPITVNGYYGPVAASNNNGKVADASGQPIFNPAKGERVDIFDLTTPAAFSYTVFDRLGRRIRSVQGDQYAGAVRWDGLNDDGNAVASGLYLIEREIDHQAQSTKKVIVLK